jgi:hypothetical protein
MNPDKILLSSLKTFFEESDHMSAMMDVIKNQSISMRVLDWFVSNYSKKNNYFFVTKEDKHFNIYLEYKSSLKSYSKRFFDPFCRGNRIEFEDQNGKKFMTTVGQLNFFRWVIKNNIVDECKNLIREVEQDMADAVRKRKDMDCGESRRELNKARIKQCIATQTRVLISFS